jgi:hypothetical protein
MRARRFVKPLGIITCVLLGTQRALKESRRVITAIGCGLALHWKYSKGKRGRLVFFTRVLFFRECFR